MVVVTGYFVDMLVVWQGCLKVMVVELIVVVVVIAV
jgi:hypothetical protein